MAAAAAAAAGRPAGHPYTPQMAQRQAASGATTRMGLDTTRGGWAGVMN